MSGFSASNYSPQVPIDQGSASQLFFSPQGAFDPSVVPCPGPSVQIACDEGVAGVGLVLHQVYTIRNNRFIFRIQLTCSCRCYRRSMTMK